MKRSVKSLTGFTISAVDGEIGKVTEFYFDDITWSIKYLVVQTGNWLSNRKVLISPQSVTVPDWEAKAFPVELTIEQVKNSPDIDTDKPASVFLEQEMDLYKYYPRLGFWAGLPNRDSGVNNRMTQVQGNINAAIPNDNNDLHLRSTDKVTGYKIKATDGDIGEVEDFIIEDKALTIHYILVNTGNWFPGKKVILSPKWIKEIRWATSEVVVNASVEQVKNSPEYDNGKEISEDYEAVLTNYYGRFISHDK